MNRFRKNGANSQEKQRLIARLHSLNPERYQPDRLQSWEVRDLARVTKEMESILGVESEVETPKRNGHDKRIIKTGEGYTVATPLDAVVDPRLSHSDYRLLSLLINLAGRNGYLWHSHKKLAELSVGPGAGGKDGKGGTARQGVNLKTIDRALARIMDADYIEILTPDQSQARGYDTNGSPTNTIVLKLALDKNVH